MISMKWRGNYQTELSFYIAEVKRRNRIFNNRYQGKYTIDYIQECILKSCSSYNRYKITFVRKYLENVSIILGSKKSTKVNSKTAF